MWLPDDDDDLAENDRLVLVPENFFAVEFTIAVAILEIVGNGEVSLNVGDCPFVDWLGDRGLIAGMEGIPGTLIDNANN